MESCMLEAGRGDYWGSWATVAATVLLPAVLGVCEWQSVRRSGYLLDDRPVARLRVNGWLLGGIGGIVGLVITRDTLARLQAGYPTVCGTYAHLLGVCSWVSLLGITFAGDARQCWAHCYAGTRISTEATSGWGRSTTVVSS